MQSYAYVITVGSKDRSSGVVHAESMEDAVKRVMSQNELIAERQESVYRPCDGAIIPQAKWLFRGERAFVYVYAPSECFC
jgi:hypothetical protein